MMGYWQTIKALTKIPEVYRLVRDEMKDSKERHKRLEEENKRRAAETARKR